MIERKKKLVFFQLALLIFGILIIYNTYYSKKSDQDEKLISEVNKEKVKLQNLKNEQGNEDVFYNIEYSGLDVSGNRYVLQSEEAYLDELKPEIVYMKDVHAVFYFKDDTVLKVWSDKGIYNNNSLDMKFKNNVKANYLNSELFAEKAEYSNSESYLSIYENVRVNDLQGNLIADKMLFDIKKQKLDITSFKDGRINANVNINEKRF